MRKTKTINFDINGKDKTLTIHELRVKDALELVGVLDEIGAEPRLPELIQLANKYLPVVVQGLTVGDLQDMAPSELMDLWNEIKEVNSVFFSLTEALEVKTMLLETGKTFVASFSTLLSSYVSVDTVTSGTTDTQHSSLPVEPPAKKKAEKSKT